MSKTEKSKEATAPGQKTRRKMRTTTKIFIIILSLVTMAFLRTGFVFILIALLPSMIAYGMDRTHYGYIYKCVFCFNLSALMPSLVKLVSTGPSSFLINELMGNGLNWLLIYGAALMGMMLVSIMSSLSQAIVTGFHKSHVINLNNNQKKIEQEWGHEVTQFSHPDNPET